MRFKSLDEDSEANIDSIINGPVELDEDIIISQENERKARKRLKVSNIDSVNDPMPAGKKKAR